MRVCYFGTFRDDYERNRLMIYRLESGGIEVIKCHVNLWGDSVNREYLASGGWLKPKFWIQLFRAYFLLTIQYFKLSDYDVMMIGYPGHLDVFLARILTRISHKPLVWDVLMSIVLIAQERILDKQSSLAINILKRIERWACLLPDWLIFDTQAYEIWFKETYQLKKVYAFQLPLGADDHIFKPQDRVPEDIFPGKYLCVYHGSFVPSHGVEYIIQAADLLKGDEEIHIILIGDGPEAKKCRQLASKYDLKNLTFTGWMDKQRLVDYLSRADVCLGTFGNTPQALMTIQNKIYECMAMGKTIINGDSQVLRSALVHKINIYLCTRKDPVSITDGILYFKGNPSIKTDLGRQSLLYYQHNLSLEITGGNLINSLTTVQRDL